MVGRKTAYGACLVGLFIGVVAVILLAAFFFIDLIQVVLSVSIASGISIGSQIVSAIRSMPELELRYVPNSDHRLYELYHHKDVPLGDGTSGHYGNYLLIGLANNGRSIARNCCALLWIYTESDFSRPVDNPFPLYWSHDPNSSQGKPPEYYSIAPGDERFLTVCYCVKGTNRDKFHFADYGQFTNRRKMMISQRLFEEPVLYIKVVAYCENGDSTQAFFRITKKDYDGLTMEKYSFLEST